MSTREGEDEDRRSREDEAVCLSRIADIEQPAMSTAPVPESAAPADANAAPAAVAARPGKSAGTYAQILMSSAVIGGSSILSIGISIVRTKLLAIMLGPAGFGLLGAYTVISDMARSWAEFGINSSGVRQIAESVGSGDMRRIALTVVVLRRTAVVLGLLGAIALMLLSNRVARVTFGDESHADAVALLGLVVFFRMVADGQGALLQGMRRIGDMARGNIIGATLSSVVMVVLVWTFGERALALSLVLGAAVSVLILWWYSRKVKVERVDTTPAAIRHEAGNLLRLGLAFMASGLLMMGATYAVRLILIRFDGLPAAGIYQSAWGLGGLYVGFILQAMGTDFYPRLVGAIGSDAETNRMVNEQARVSLLLAGPGVIATLVFAPIAISLFYTAEFAPAADVLRWICMGMALRVISWPMGYIIVSRNHQMAFIATELAWTIVNVGATLALVKLWGIQGAGVAFFLSYVFHVAIIYPIVRRLSGFRWERDNFLSGSLFVSGATAVTMGFVLLPVLVANIFGIVVTLASCIYSLRALATLVPPEHLPRRVRALVSRFAPRPIASIKMEQQ